MIKIILDCDRKKYKKELKILNKILKKEIVQIIRNKLIPIKRKIASILLYLKLYIIIIFREKMKG